MYITEANQRRLFDSVTTDSIDIELLISAYHQLSELLSEPELRQLTCIDKIFLGDEQLNVIRMVRPYDNSGHVYSQSTPYYHNSKDCPRLQNDYINVSIPKQIRSLGEKEVARYRSFFPSLSPDDSTDDKKRKITAGANAVMADYAAKGIVLSINEIFEIVERPHTQTIAHKKTSDLADKIQEYRNFLQSLQNNDNPAIRQIYNSRFISTKEIASIYKNRNAEEINLIQEMKTHRENIFSACINQIKILRNFGENDFNERTLTKLGFKACSQCATSRFNVNF